MSIIDTFDDQSEEIIKPWRNIKRVDDFPVKVLVTFSANILECFLQLCDAEQIDTLSCGFAKIPIYRVILGESSFAVYLTMLGDSASAVLMEEVIAKGGRQFLYFGSCGVLDHMLISNKLIIPTAAYRDEGVSYHYQPSFDYIEIDTAKKLETIMKQLDYPFIVTKTWTTAAFYRETKNNMIKRKSEGCLVVEMECASLAAVAKYRNVEFYEFFYTEDSLDGAEWEPRVMGKLQKGDHIKYMNIALQIIERI